MDKFSGELLRFSRIGQSRYSFVLRGVENGHQIDRRFVTHPNSTTHNAVEWEFGKTFDVEHEGRSAIITHYSV